MPVFCSSTLTLQGTNGGVQTIVINMVSGCHDTEHVGLAVQQLDRRHRYHQRCRLQPGNDTILVSSQHTRFDGGAGSDTVDYSTWGGGFTLTLNDIHLGDGDLEQRSHRPVP